MSQGLQHCGLTALRVVVACTPGLSDVPEVLRACSQRCVSGAAVSLLSFCNAQKIAHCKSGTPARWCHPIASAPRWLFNKGSMCLKHQQQPPQRAAHTACTLACVRMGELDTVRCGLLWRDLLAWSGGVSLRYGWPLQDVSLVACLAAVTQPLFRAGGLCRGAAPILLNVVPNVCLFVPVFTGATRVRAGCSCVVLQSPEAAVSPGLN
jgi:hypothetical protein